ncbi:hypothetical protein DPX39_090040500 [Trypanosoma brucei equiperdum]|uniref:Uncharacterized protein n=1 Tax=Trypanosoma brucei equiperdum TaxID=630700 RepID=A0A3L6L5S3_9TRYP|nr:hypothetical protein DPX39_090040500 [Trypanosoma brucei equiperdum]
MNIELHNFCGRGRVLTSVKTRQIFDRAVRRRYAPHCCCLHVIAVRYLYCRVSPHCYSLFSLIFFFSKGPCHWKAAAVLRAVARTLFLTVGPLFVLRLFCSVGKGSPAYLRY